MDYDNDGWLDIFVLCGTQMDAQVSGASNRLYQNNRDGTFSDVALRRLGSLKTGWASGITVGDYNNDGFEDIFITYYGQNVLYRNNGRWHVYRRHERCRSSCMKATPAGDRGVPFWTTDRDGHLDLFVANYVELRARTRIPQPGGQRPVLQFQRSSCQLWPPRVADAAQLPVSQPGRWDVSRCLRGNRHNQNGADLFDDHRRRGPHR